MTPARTKSVRGDGSGKHVLLVDDEPYVLESLRRLLGAEGLECLTAPDVPRAKAILAEREVAVVVTDLSMPGEDGMALLRRSRELDPERPVIVLTGVGTVPAAVAAMKAGALDFLSKPVDPEALLARVKEEEARARRGKLKVFFGAAAGVGKTYAMLEAAREQREDGVDVVVGVVEVGDQGMNVPVQSGLVLGQVTGELGLPVERCHAALWGRAARPSS